MEYLIPFINYYSTHHYVYLIEYISKALEKLKEYKKKEVETKLGRKIKSLNSD